MTPDFFTLLGPAHPHLLKPAGSIHADHGTRPQHLALVQAQTHQIRSTVGRRTHQHPAVRQSTVHLQRSTTRKSRWRWQLTWVRAVQWQCMCSLHGCSQWVPHPILETLLKQTYMVQPLLAFANKMLVDGTKFFKTPSHPPRHKPSQRASWPSSTCSVSRMLCMHLLI